MRGRPQRKVLGALLAALSLALAACGVTDAPLAPEFPEPVPTDLTPPAPTDADIRPILAAVAREVAQTRNWRAVAHSEVIGPDGSRDFNVSRITYQRPGMAAATILDARERRKIGTRLVFDGASKVALKTYFFGFLPIQVTLDVNDGRLLDSYKRSLKDTSTEQFVGVLLHPQAQVKRVGRYMMDGEAVELMDVRSPASWKELSREVIGISHRLLIPVYRDCYNQRNERIFHLELKGMRTNIPTTKKDFSLD